MKRLGMIVALSLMTLGSFAPVQAQDMNSFVELLRKDVKAEKTAVITMVMEFTDAESEVFWPIYREYEFESEKLMDLRIALIREYAESYESMTNDIAKDLMGRVLKIQEKRLKLDKKYWKTFSKKLNPITAARFMQVNGQINDLIDLQIASEMPLVEATGSEMD
jgi:hypothetical protein